VPPSIAPTIANEVGGARFLPTVTAVSWSAIRHRAVAARAARGENENEIQSLAQEIVDDRQETLVFKSSTTEDTFILGIG